MSQQNGNASVYGSIDTTARQPQQKLFPKPVGDAAKSSLPDVNALTT